jgi:hypothetical protein
VSGEGDPHHPLVERPWEYEIVGLAYHRDPDTWIDSYIDLVLQRGESRRHLRFLGPQDLRIDEGFPSSAGLCILDVSRRQLDGIGVRVANFEASGGCPTFWARGVVELEAGDHTSPCAPECTGREGAAEGGSMG